MCYFKFKMEPYTSQAKIFMMQKLAKSIPQTVLSETFESPIATKLK